MIKNDCFNKKTIVLIVPFVYIFLGNMLEVQSVNLPYRDLLSIIMTVIGIICLFYTLLNNIVYASNVLFILLFFIILILFDSISLYIEFATIQFTIMQISFALLWISAFSLAYCIGYKNNTAVYTTKWYVLLIPIFAYTFLGVKEISGNTGIAMISSAYYSLCLLPFVFMIRNEVIKWVFLFCIFAVVLLSFKRAGFIAFFLAMVTYFILERNKDKSINKRVLTILFRIMIILLLYYFFIKITSVYNLDILMRIKSVGTDGGSGRIEIWGNTWNMILNSNLMELFFGHGYNAVYHLSTIKYSAHNDFLEVLYDYGIIGLGLYGVFIKKIINIIKKLYIKESKLLVPITTSFVIMICLSIFSHLVIYPTYFIFFCILWGMTMGMMDYEDMMIKGRN